MDDKTGVYKIEVLVIDHDDIGPDEVKAVIENTRYPNRCISPEVKGIETREVEWSDDHPLNLMSKADEAYRKLFDDGHVRVPRRDAEMMASFACEHVQRGGKSCDVADIERGGCCNACWARRSAERVLG